MANPHQIPFTRILIMSALFGIAYFAIYYRSDGYSDGLLVRSLTGMVMFGVFYYFSGKLLKRWMSKEED